MKRNGYQFNFEFGGCTVLGVAWQPRDLKLTKSIFAQEEIDQMPVSLRDIFKMQIKINK